MEKCQRCGSDQHELVGCPGVKAIEFGFDLNNARTIKRVEFLTPADCGTSVVERSDDFERVEKPGDYPRLPVKREPNGTQN